MKQLQRRRALTAQHVRVVKRRYEAHAVLGGQALGNGQGIVFVAVVTHHLRAIATGGRQLGGRGVMRHDDGGRDVQNLRRQGHGLGVVARRVSHHPGPALGRRQPRQGIEAAAKLESPHALEVFALDKRLRAQLRVERARLQHRGAVGMALQPCGGGQDVFKSGQGAGIVHG